MSLLTQDLAKLKKLAKKAWWLGILVGFACNMLPPKYQGPCKAVVDACRALSP